MKARLPVRNALAGRCAIAALVLTSCAGWASAGIIINPFPPAPTVTPFPDDDPPSDLPAGEDADHTSVTSMDYTFEAGGSPSAVTVNGVDATVSATSDIRIPESNNNANDNLYKHEVGHHKLASSEYTKRAKPKMEAAVRSVQGKTYPSQAAAETAVDTALGNALDSITRQIDVLQTSYDSMTNHGQKDTPTADDAYNSLIGAGNAAPTSGSGRAAVDTSRSWAGSGDPPTVQFIGDDLHFGGDLVIDQTSDPLDPLRNVGVFAIGNMLPIGINDNGTVMLSDANFAIGSLGSATLVTGALFEASYGTSEVPGFAGMIQASLYITPSMWGGVDNAMGSPMLAEMASASNAGTLMTFWFLSDEPLFDQTGTPVASAAVTGKVRIGYTVPTPGSTMMLAIGLTTCVWGLRRR